MTVKQKKVFLVTGSIIALLIVVIIASVHFIDLNNYKPRIEAAASDALKMDFRVKGKIGIVLFPDFGVSLENVFVKNRGVDFISANQVRIGLKVIPIIIRREIQISKFELIKPSFYIESDKSGKFNFEQPGQKSRKQKEFPAALPKVGKFIISKGGLVYSDKRSGNKTELKGFDLKITDLSFNASRGQDPLRKISFGGDFKCEAIKTRDFEISNLMFDITGKDGIFTIDPITMKFFGGSEKGSIKADVTGEIPLFKIKYTASKFRFEKFLKTLSQKNIIKGEMDFSLNFTTRGKSLDELKRRINGETSLRGENLLLYSFDLDSLVSKIEESRSFSLVDAGAFLLAGPFGTALTKGYDFAGVYKETRGGEGTVRRLVSEWKVKNSVAEAEDVALATKRNRIVLKGRLDFIKERFDDVTVAVLDERGCAKFSQKIRGPFRNPEVDKISSLESIVSPVLKLFEGAKGFFEKGKCEVFYAGSVQHPK